MSIKAIPLILLLLTFNACAEPKYLDYSGSSQEQSQCRAKFTSGQCVDFIWEKMPTEAEFGSFLFQTFSQSQADRDPVLEDLKGNMTVLLWMPSMGHGSSPVKVERLDVGKYRATNVFFSMRGEWEIHIQSKIENEIQDEAIIPISL